MREVNRFWRFVTLNVPTLKYMGKINIYFPDEAVFSERNIVFGNHTDWSDSFAICKSFQKMTHGQMHPNDFLYPIMRDDFFGSPDSILNHALKSAGVLLIGRDGSREEKEQQFLDIKETILAGDSILVFPAKTRSKTGEIFYHVDELSRPTTIPRQMDMEINLMPVNYTFNPVSRYANVRFGEPITFIPWSKEKGTRGQYFERLDNQVYDSIGSLTTVNMTHLIASYIDAKLEGTKEFSISGHDMMKKISNAYYALRGSGLHLDRDLSEFRFNEAFHFLEGDSAVSNVYKGVKFTRKDIPASEIRKKDKIKLYSNQVKHLAIVQDCLERVIS